MRPLLLDLFCKAGGAGTGYQRAGFDVVGVDHEPQPRYPFHFIRADALAFVAEHGWEYDAIHASPPCKRHTAMMEIRVDDVESRREVHRDLITPLRPLLARLDVPYVIENVPGAHELMRNPAMLCGTMFGLPLLRHRLFETNWLYLAPQHPAHEGSVAGGEYVGVYGSGGSMWADKAKTVRRKGSRKADDWRAAMEMPWARKYELTQAIPPAYTEHIGLQLIAALAPATDRQAGAA